MIQETRLILSNNPIPPGGRERAVELLDACLALSKMFASSNPAKPAAALLGARGGKATAKRGPEYFAQISAMRKTRAGGRPKKND
jgi:hypothetical protein